MIRAVALGILLAGCLSGPAPGVADVPTSNVPDAFALPFAMDGCNGNAIFLLEDPVSAAQHLPGGFRPREATGLFDSVPAATGQTAIFVASMTCPDEATDLLQGPHGYAFVAVFVEAPAVEAAVVNQPSRYDFYMPGLLMDQDDLHGLVDRWGWPVEAANVTVANTVLAPDAPDTPLEGKYVGIGDAAVTTNLTYNYQVPAPAPGNRDGLVLPLDGLLMRIWTQSPQGLGLLEYRFTHDVPLGPVSTCVFPEGSLPERILDRTNCTQKEPKPGDDPYDDRQAGALFENLEAGARLIWIPGGRA